MALQFGIAAQAARRWREFDDTLRRAREETTTPEEYESGCRVAVKRALLALEVESEDDPAGVAAALERLHKERP